MNSNMLVYFPNPKISRRKASRFLTLTACVALLPLAASAVVPGVYHYSLVNDWSDTQNPNGPWSYNMNSAPITTHQTFWFGQAGWGYSYIADGSIMKGSYYTDMIDPWGESSGTAHDWLPGDVMMHALSLAYGGDSTFLNVAWTSPADGTINIDGRAWDGQLFAGRDVGWQLTVGGHAIAQLGSVYGLFRNDAAAQFGNNLVNGNQLNNIAVTKGEVVDFLVATDTYYGQFVGIQENIDLTVVPEPTTISLALACLAGACLVRKRA